jgi:hypothetical protein
MAYHKIMTDSKSGLGFRASIAPLSWSGLRHLLERTGIIKTG